MYDVPGVRLVVLAGRGGLRSRKKLGAELNLSVHLEPDKYIPRTTPGTGDSCCCTLHRLGQGRMDQKYRRLGAGEESGISRYGG